MTPTFISHCESVYNALLERATVQYSEVEKADVLVFTGAVSPVYKSLNISQTYYGPIFQTLEGVGAILKVQKGGRGIDSIIALKGLPDEWPEDLGWRGPDRQYAARNRTLTTDPIFAKILLDVQEIQESIGGINILLALEEQEKRIADLELKVEKRK